MKQRILLKLDMVLQKMQSNISLQKGTNSIDISTLSSGVYVLKINAEEGKADFKFVKQ